MELPDLPPAQPQHLSQHLIGVLPQERRAAHGEAAAAAEVQRAARHQVGPHPRVFDLFEHRIARGAAWILAHQLAERLVGTPGDVRSVEGRAHLGERPRREPTSQDRGDEVACLEAPRLRVEVVADSPLDSRERLGGPGGRDERRPLPRRQRDHHHPPAVMRLEVVAKRAIEVVPVLPLVAAAELRFRDAAEVADHGKGHIGK